MGLPQQGPAAGKASPEEMQRQVFAAVRALVARFAAVAPTVLALEDLHWADPTSLRLTAELAELARDRPLLLLATSRPGPHALPPAREVRLRALPADAAEALATSLLGKVGGPQVLAAALASTDGNPLFLEERLAEMLEAGALVKDEGTWRLREPGRPPLPQVLERLVRSRVDRLSADASDAIRAAAVLGPEFTAGLLAATLGTTQDALAPVLAELSASDLVHHAERSRSVFLFRHALIQEATYLALLRAERRDLHARAARAIEAAASERLPEVAAILGRHYAAAEDAGRAVRYLELAGDHATDAFANDEAVASFREALAVTGRAGAEPTGAELTGAELTGAELTGTAVQLHAKLANVLWRTAHREEARAAFQAALGLAGIGSVDPVLRAHLYIRLGRLQLIECRYAEAAEAFDSAERLLAFDPAQAGGGDEAGDGARGAGTVADHWLELMVDGRADLHMMCLDADLALAVLEEARPVLEARGGPARQSAFYRLQTMQKLVRNRLRVDDEDIANLRASITAAEQTGEDKDKDAGYATNFLGWALCLRGDLAEATEALTRALRMADRIGETVLRHKALFALTLTALRRHDAQSVRALLPRALAAARAAGDGIAGAQATAAWLAWQDGEPGAVLRLAAEIEEQDPRSIGWGAMYRWVYLFPLLAAHLQLGDTAAAVAAARQVIDPSQQLLPDDLTAALTAACASRDQGDQARTTRLLTDALAVARTRAYF